VGRQQIDKVAGIEAGVHHRWRGGASGLRRLVPIRKKGKLPHTTVRIAYSLEYGLDEMEMHADAISSWRARHPGRRPDCDRGTRGGPVKLMRRSAPNVVAACFIIDLPDLGGARNYGRWTCECDADGIRRALRFRDSVPLSIVVPGARRDDELRLCKSDSIPARETEIILADPLVQFRSMNPFRCADSP